VAWPARFDRGLAPALCCVRGPARTSFTPGTRVQKMALNVSVTDTRCPLGLKHQRGYGATVARPSPDPKVGSSSLSGLNVGFLRVVDETWRVGKPILRATAQRHLTQPYARSLPWPRRGAALGLVAALSHFAPARRREAGLRPRRRGGLPLRPLRGLAGRRQFRRRCCGPRFRRRPGLA
jgi:hypothetical protein